MFPYIFPLLCIVYKKLTYFVHTLFISLRYALPRKASLRFDFLSPSLFILFSQAENRRFLRFSAVFRIIELSLGQAAADPADMDCLL